MERWREEVKYPYLDNAQHTLPHAYSCVECSQSRSHVEWWLLACAQLLPSALIFERQAAASLEGREREGRVVRRAYYLP